LHELTWVVVATAIAYLLRAGVHALILRGLRAPRVAHQRTPADLRLSAKEVRLPTNDHKTLFGWFVPVADQSPAPAIVVMHGWGANASMMLPAVEPLHAAGFSVLLLDARCHGQSDTASFSSLPRFAQDIEAGLDWLGNQSCVDAQRIAVIGHSVGAGAALLCGTRRADVRAVISLSAFAHPRDIMRTFLAQAHIPYPVLGWYVMHHVQKVIGARFDDISPENSMSRIRCPVLLVHGRDDDLVPCSDAGRLGAAARRPDVRTLIVEGGHDPSDALLAHQADLIGFLRMAFRVENEPLLQTNLSKE